MKVSGQLHASVKGPPIPIGQEAVWAPAPFWMRWRRAKYPYIYRVSNPGRSARSLVTILTELPPHLVVSFSPASGSLPR
jgi:hypothetical protein